MENKCKRHKWRLGAGIGELINGKIIETKKIIWCEKCGKKIKVNVYSDYELIKMKGRKNEK